MFQNPNMAYPNMLNFQMNTRPLDPSNQFQYTLQQQAQRVMYPYILNTNLPQTQPQIQTLPNNCYPTQINQTNANIINNVNNINNTNNQNASNQDGSTTNAESNNQNNTQNSPTMSLLTKYKDIYVPSIYLMDYNDTTKSPFNILAANSSQNQTQYNQITGQVINNNQNNSVLNKYLNYGYNFEQWKLYVNDIKSKFDELNDLVKNGVIRLPDPENELEYLMAFPSDYGGLGNVQNDQNYENVKFYDPKDTTKNQSNKNFMSLIKFDHDQIWFPLEPNPQSLNKQQINDYYKNINSHVNPYLKLYFQPNFFYRNPNTNLPLPVVSNSEQNNNGNNSNKTENDQNEKER